jgi:hypothetical protein
MCCPFLAQSRHGKLVPSELSAFGGNSDIEIGKRANSARTRPRADLFICAASDHKLTTTYH